MLHNRYRKAKHFKLDDDLYVDDEFSTGKKRAVKSGWDWYDRRHGHWGVHGNSIRRFLTAQVGKNYATVYSDFVRRARNADDENFLREQFHNKILQVKLVDGVPYDLNQNYRSSGHPLSWGELYRDPLTGKIEMSKAEKYKRPKYKGLIHLDVNEDLKFELDCIKYNKRIAPGVLVEVKEDIWVKKTRYEYDTYDFRMEKNSLTNKHEYVKFYRKEFGWRKTTASKRELKQYKLKELQNDNSDT